MPGLRFSTGRGGFETLPYIQALATTEPWLLFRHGPRISAGGPASSGEYVKAACGSWLIVVARSVSSRRRAAGSAGGSAATVTVYVSYPKGMMEQLSQRPARDILV